MNTDLLSNSDRSEIFLDSLPGGFHLADKDLLSTYIHNRGGLTSNLDHVIVSDSPLLSSIDHVDDSKIDNDHLPITCQLSCSMASSVQHNSQVVLKVKLGKYQCSTLCIDIVPVIIIY